MIFPLLSAQDCPPEAGDFRAQQCSAHADVRFQGRYHEWLPVYNDPENPCALKCSAKDSGLVVELAPKVLDGTRCYTESLDMCISGACQVGRRPVSGGAVKTGQCEGRRGPTLVCLFPDRRLRSRAGQRGEGGQLRRLRRRRRHLQVGAGPLQVAAGPRQR